MRVRSRLPCEAGQGATLALSRPGWSDLTTDVNFTELAAAGEAHGLTTVFFGPQTGLQRLLPSDEEDHAACPPLVTNASPPLRRGVIDAFYSLGSFVMLVQATPGFAATFSFRQASQPLYGAGHPSLGAMALVHSLRTLGRIAVEQSLALQRSHDEPTRVPTERELVAALSDALVTTVPCFKAHWRPMARGVLRLLQAARGAAEGEAPTLPPLYRLALELVRQDLEVLLLDRSTGPEQVM